MIVGDGDMTDMGAVPFTFLPALYRSSPSSIAAGGAGLHLQKHFGISEDNGGGERSRQ
jgi:hypothetical protein